MQYQYRANAVGHFDICGPDLGALAGFYEGVFGWTVSPAGPGYSRLSTPGLGGALTETPEPSLTIGVVVADLEASVREAGARGGEVVMPPTDNGWVKKAQVRDPAGNVLTLIQA